MYLGEGVVPHRADSQGCLPWALAQPNTTDDEKTVGNTVEKACFLEADTWVWCQQVCRPAPMIQANMVTSLKTCPTGPHTFLRMGGEMTGPVCYNLFKELEPPTPATPGFALLTNASTPIAQVTTPRSTTGRHCLRLTDEALRLSEPRK